MIITFKELKMNKTIILNREDVNNPLHPNLWEDFMETLGLSPDTTEVCLDKSKLDENKVIRDEKFSINDTVSLSNNTSLVCGTVKSINHNGEQNTYFVEWDDVLYSGGSITENWYEEDWLEKV